MPIADRVRLIRRERLRLATLVENLGSGIIIVPLEDHQIVKPDATVLAD